MYKYSLDKSPKKFECPQCLKKRLVRYIDTETDDYVDHKVGRCDREINCGYHYTPKMYFEQNNVSFKNYYIPNNVKKEIVTSYHSKEELKLTLDNFKKNNFVKFLNQIFNKEQVLSIINNYKIGTASYWYNGTVFWQIDNDHKIRSGKIISYQESGKRTQYVYWVHSYQIKKGIKSHFNLKQCLFGEHLVKSKNQTIAIVESEKTACIMSQIFDKYTWLACGNLSGLLEEKLRVIKQHKIILYPDLGLDKGNGSPFLRWSLQKDRLNKLGYHISISDLLEENGTDNQKRKGFDIADYFVNQSQNEEIVIKTTEDLIYQKIKKRSPNIDCLRSVFDIDIKEIIINTCE
ncbi:hypothetical protein FHR24_002125 [Wenyingzhuangia heitensis]|uniref:Toprim-like n=1 Tax=Wenyingzhuangia heitensis TaxID=1487859 RepID=A0ABX0UA29_9FLAO|nr:DUF6371 domain-containing protein [Wenyingzhuangia heitensis]NIJ45657.1 hypothetical protein [Wenyingzhuangia heitensis]